MKTILLVSLSVLACLTSEVWTYAQLPTNKIDPERTANLLAIVRDDKKPEAIRNRAIIFLFQKYATGKSVYSLSATWKPGDWLKPKDVWVQDVVGGYIPLNLEPGKTVVVIAPHFASAIHLMIFLRISIRVDTSTFQAMLLQANPAGKRAFVEKVVCYDDHQGVGD